MRRLLILLVPLVLLVGCSGGNGELSKQEDKDLRHNFARGLTKEEIAHMGGAPKGPADPKAK